MRTGGGAVAGPGYGVGVRCGEAVLGFFLRWLDSERETEQVWAIRERFAWLTMMTGVIGVVMVVPLLIDGEWRTVPGGVVLMAGGVSGLLAHRYRWDVPASRRHTLWSFLALVVAIVVTALLLRTA